MKHKSRTVALEELSLNLEKQNLKSEGIGVISYYFDEKTLICALILPIKIKWGSK